jgi:ABC-type nitrate/sulfonate/bicarbonate transport system substrate-binding protein
MMSVVKGVRTMGMIGLRRMLLAVGLAAGIGQTALAQSPTKLDLAASNTWWGQVPLMVAIDKGFFREQSIEVELKNIPASGDRVAALRV